MFADFKTGELIYRNRSYTFFYLILIHNQNWGRLQNLSSFGDSLQN